MIKIEKLTKNYGDTTAVNNIDLEIKDGEILGFLGPNGAGKTTTIRAITGYLKPTSGNILVNGVSVLKDSFKIKKQIGYMPEVNPLYDEMIVRDHLKFAAKIRSINEKQFEKSFEFVVEKCGISEVVSKTINQLSKGYKQRVGLAQAILHDPKILILDEPTSGLDPNQIVEIRKLIKELGKKKTLILSSHILGEVQALCDRIVIIKKGKIVADGTPDELKTSFQGKAQLFIHYQDKKNQMKKLNFPFAQIKNEVVEENGEKILTLTYDITKDIRSDVYKKIKSTDIIILEMQRKQINLEDIFINLTKEA